MGAKHAARLLIATTALDYCIALLATLSESHWWLPEDVQYLARDLKPRVEQLAGPIKNGIQNGTTALREMISDLLGEDALAIAQTVAYAATVTGNAGAKHNHTPGAAARAHPGAAAGASTTAPVAKVPTGKKSPAAKVSPGKEKEHKGLDGSNRQSVGGGSGGSHHGRREIGDVLTSVSRLARGLVGEHMADYYHMEHILDARGAWPHGNVKGAWKTEFPRLVSQKNGWARPMELIPEDLNKVCQNGLDSIWSIGPGTFHFIEAKFSTSGGVVYGMGKSKEDPSRKNPFPKPPVSLTDRQLALWYLLAEPEKGTQMGVRWIRRSTAHQPMHTATNLKNRWLYLIVAIDTVGHPFGKIKSLTKPLHLRPADGIVEHLEAAAEILATGDFSNMRLHDKHKPVHGVSETFDHEEIDFIVEQRDILASAKKNSPSPAPFQRKNSAAKPVTKKDEKK